MNTPHLSSQTLSCFVIAMIGLIGFTSVVISNEYLNNKISDNHQNAFLGFLRMESDDLLESLQETSGSLGLALQHDVKFREALYRNNKQELVKQLDNQFHQYFVTARVIKLEKIIVLNTEFKAIAESTEGELLLATKHVCPELISRANIRKGADRFKVIGEMCLINKRPFHVMLIPIGGLRLNGYLQVATDPSLTLRAVQKNLSLPVRIATADNKNLYQSKDWLAHRADEDYLVTTYVYKISTGEAAIRISVQHDAAALDASTNKARVTIYFAAALSMLGAIFFASQVLRRTNLKPLLNINQTLSNRFSSVEFSTTEMTPAGHKEAIELTNNINILLQKLQTQTDIDPLTTLYNRHYFLSQLKSAIAHETVPTKYSLIIMHIGSLRTINESIGYEAGDEMLKQTAERFIAVFCGEQKKLAERNAAQRCLTARISNDYFAAFLPYTTEDKTAVVARKIISIMDESFLIKDATLNNDIHTGIAMYPKDGTQVNQLLNHAEVALKQAQNQKQKFAFFQSKDAAHQTS